MLRTVKASWFKVAPCWQATPAELKMGLAPSFLPRPWQMLLLGDGAVTRHLQLLTAEDIDVDVLAMEPITTDDLAPMEVNAIPRPHLRRQVWLRTASGQRLAYATSWWNSDHVDTYLANRNLGIWKSLAAQRTEHFRDLRGLCRGFQPELAEAFGVRGAMWARHYLLWSHGEPITLIYEVFSPILNEYLGTPAEAEDVR